MLQNVMMMMVGGFLVWFGVLGGSLAERIRGVRVAPKAHVAKPTRAVAKPSFAEASAMGSAVPVPIMTDVIGALVGLGYKPALAKEAAAEARKKLGFGAPLEVWIREALRAAPNVGKA